MKIKKYLGKNKYEILNKIKIDLGPDAVILNSREIKKKGLLGVFSKPMLEITAAVQERKPEKPKETLKEQNQISQIKEKMKIVEPKIDGKEDIDKLETKIDKIEGLINELVKAKDTTNNEVSNKGETRSNYDGVYKLLYNNLKNNSVDEDIIDKIILWSQEVIQNNKNQSISNLIYNRIIFLLGKPEPIEEEQDVKPYIVAFVGPTGVGKTTTIAKLAANFVINRHKKVGFITSDTYRIAAVEQLKTYSDILGANVKVAYDNDDIVKAIEDLKNNDFIFIDTAGRSHKNEEHMKELNEMFNNIKPNRVFMVMNTNTNLRDAKDIVDKYSFIKDYSFIFTKLDETSVYGLILNMRYITKKNISYITTGQNVPEDITTPDMEDISKRLIGS